MLRGAARTQSESSKFYWVVETYRPIAALLMVPTGVDMIRDARDRVHMMGSAGYGDALAGLWEIASIRNKLMGCLAANPLYRHICTMGVDTD